MRNRQKFSSKNINIFQLKKSRLNATTIPIYEKGITKARCAIFFPYRYFPVINILMKSICFNLSNRKSIPKEWEEKTITIISILRGKYPGWVYLNNLLKGAELWGKPIIKRTMKIKI